MTQEGWVELLDFNLETQIGHYGPDDIRPDEHLLDLTLKIDACQVLVQQDGMGYVFDYDPLIAEIEKIGADTHYETQERLMTRIAQACASYQEIKTIEIKLRKTPVRNGRGVLGVRLSLDEHATNELRMRGFQKDSV